ncbi:MAG: TIGR04283 family arsenosugar biosynthesis glycosyltransferase [Ferruginibacter sp.]
MQKISIIIPTYNEVATIAKLITYLQKHGGNSVLEIIISDGESNDETPAIAGQAGAKVLISPQKGRAAQMNYGAANSNGDVLYFVHADSFPPVNFASDIIMAVSDGYDFGRYRTKFDSSRFLLKINAWFTRFNWFICYGGDQTLFITDKLFEQSGGFKNELLIMEEYEFAERLIKQYHYKIFNDAALVSARKYEGRSWLKVQLANRKSVKSFKKGLPQQQIMEEYKMMLGKGV